MSTAYPLRFPRPDLLGKSRTPAISHARPFVSDKWQKTGLFLIIGYILFNRSFAYLGIPQLKLFIGELVDSVCVLHSKAVAEHHIAVVGVVDP